jgi:hypothetical protein
MNCHFAVVTFNHLPKTPPGFQSPCCKTLPFRRTFSPSTVPHPRRGKSRARPMKRGSVRYSNLYTTVSRSRLISAKSQRSKARKACLLGVFAPLRLGALNSVGSLARRDSIQTRAWRSRSQSDECVLAGQELRIDAPPDLCNTKPQRRFRGQFIRSFTFISFDSPRNRTQFLIFLFL